MIELQLEEEKLEMKIFHFFLNKRKKMSWISDI
jgi:hypothetical protein